MQIVKPYHTPWYMKWFLKFMPIPTHVSFDAASPTGDYSVKTYYKVWKGIIYIIKTD